MPCILIFQINYQKAHVSTLHTTTALLSPEIKSGTLSELLTRSLIGLSCCPPEKCLWHSITKSWIVISVCWKVVKISTSLFRCFVNWHASCWGSEGKQMKGSFFFGHACPANSMAWWTPLRCYASVHQCLSAQSYPPMADPILCPTSSTLNSDRSCTSSIQSVSIISQTNSAKQVPIVCFSPRSQDKWTCFDGKMSQAAQKLDPSVTLRLF